MRRWAWVALWLAAAAANAQSARLSISVVDQEQRPVAGVWASVACLFAPVARVDDERARSDAAGRLVFDGLVPGRYGVRLSGQPYHDWTSGAIDLVPGDNRLTAHLWPLLESPDAAIVEVLVIGRDGQPAAHTEVEVDTDGPAQSPQPRYLALGGLTMRYGSSLGFAQRGVMTTDAQGRIRFRCPAGPLKVCVTARHEKADGQPIWAPPGRVTWLRAPLAAGQPETSPSGKSDRPEPMAKLRGQVLDAAERPMARLRFALRLPVDSRHFDGLPLPYSTDPAARAARTDPGLVTDDQGRFEVDILRDCESLRIKAAGWCSSGLEAIDAKADEPVTFRLTEPARRVAGRVVDAEGRPVPGAVAWAAPSATYSESDSDGPMEVRALDTSVPPVAGIAGLLPSGEFAVACDAEGRFVFDQLDLSSYRFGAWAAGWGGPTVVSRQADERPGEPLALRLTRRAVLAGIARRPDGSRWPGAPVTVSCAEPRRDINVSADLEGRWRLELAPGRRHVVVSLPGCLDQEADLTLVGAETTQWTARTHTGWVLTGRVLTGEGRPLAYARVQSPGPDGVPREAWTDADGRFSLAGLRTGERELIVESERGPERPVQVGLPHAEPLTIRLPRRASVVGRVIDQAGRPVPGAECLLSRERDDRGRIAIDDRLERRTVADAQGRFALADVRAGAWSLSVDREPYSYSSTDITLRPGEQRRGLAVVLKSHARDTAPKPTGTVRGRVLQVDGTPAAGAKVEYDHAGVGGDEDLTTDGQGEYRLADVEVGRFRARAEADGCYGDRVEVTVKAGAEAVMPDIKLLQRVVTGRLLGLPTTIKPGQCQIDGGVFALDADGREVPQREACPLPQPPLTAEEQRAASHEPSRRGTIPMVFYDFGELLFPGAVRAGGCYPRMMIDVEPPVAQGDGTFRVPLRPGRQRLTVRTVHPRGANGAWLTLANVLIDVPAAGPAHFEVPVSLGSATLAGRLAVGKGGHEGEEMPLSVAAYPLDSWTPAAVVFPQADGSWRLSGLAPGEYRIAYGREFSACRYARAEARAGETVTVPCDTSPGQTLRGQVRGKLPRDLLLMVESDVAVQSALVGRDGRFALLDLPPGDYRCRLWSSSADRLLRPPGAQRPPGPEVLLDW